MKRNEVYRSFIHDHSLVNRFQQACDFREMQTLYKALDPNESILQAVNGLVPGNNNGTGLAILTQKRVIFFNHGLFYGMSAPSIPLSKINSVTPKTGLIHGEILFDNGAQTFVVHNILAWKCDTFVDAINSAVEKYVTHSDSAQGNQSNNNTPNDAEQLMQLHKMLEDGTLSPTEFQHEKEKIIKK